PFQIIFTVPDVGVQRDVVDVVSERVEHGAIPPDPVGAAAVVAGAAGDQLDVAIDGAHRLPRFQRESGVFFGALMTELPGAVDLVSQAPVDYFVGRLMSVLATLICPVGMFCLIAILDPVTRVVYRSEAEVHADIRLSPYRFAIPQEFIGA